MGTGRCPHTLETNCSLLKRQRLSSDRRSMTPFARDFSRRLLRCPQARARGQAGRVDPGRARRQRTRGQNAPHAPNYAAAEDRRSGAATFEVAVGPFPVPSQDTAKVDEGTAGPSTTPPPGARRREAQAG